MIEGVALLTIGLVGFRHGFDVDHVAAITDIAASSVDRRRALRLATLYVLGHAVVVFILGLVAVSIGETIPSGFDQAMRTVTGVTLVLLGGLVLYSLIRHGADFRLRSRWMLLVGGLSRAVGWLAGRKPREVLIEHEHEHEHAEGDPSRSDHHEHGHDGGMLVQLTSTLVKTSHRHIHRHRALEPTDPFRAYGPAGAFGIGMIHGTGAETPTQLLLLVAAAGASSGGRGILVVAVFVVGLLIANTLLAVAATLSLTRRRALPRLYVIVGALAGAGSVALGLSYLLSGGGL